jgi:hypothetical protein
MKITTDIWNETDKEKRSFLWSYYLQQVDHSIRSLKLSPKYKEVKSNQRELRQLVAFIEALQNKNQELVGIDLHALELLYQANKDDESLIARLDEIRFEYIPEIEKRFQEYNQLKAFLYDSVSIHTIGIENIYSKEGYIFLRNRKDQNIFTYSYFVSNYVNENKRTLVKLNPISQFKYKLGTNLINKKMQLNKGHSYNLNCYLIETEVELPLQATLLPIAKGKLSRYLLSA